MNNINKKKWIIIGGAIFVALVGIGVTFALNRSKSVPSPVVENKPAETQLDIGKPSEGTNHIVQKIDSQNPYTVTSQKAAENFAKTNEGKLIAQLFDNLDSSDGTQVLKELNGLQLGDVQENTTISPEFKAMLWGYRLQDDPKRLLFDGNILKSFQPHNGLLSYLQVLRSPKNAEVNRVGMIVPELGSTGSYTTSLSVDGKDQQYLIQKEKGSLLIKQDTGNQDHYYTAQYELYIAIPRGAEAIGKPYFIWDQELNLKVEPVADKDIAEKKKAFFAE